MKDRKIISTIVSKPGVYDAALALWGYDRQVLKTAEECNELAASCTRFISHKANVNRLAEEAADVEIMIEQLRHNGLGDLIEHEKSRKLTRLAHRVGVCAAPVVAEMPFVSTLLKDAIDELMQAESLYLDRDTSNRLAAGSLRRCIALLMQAAQNMIREQQQAESRQGAQA
ncbi:TPA: hypothetical protein QH731_003559 [Klebsiella variicola]|nr:hypothetical protein [Klebsiella variicola]